MGVIDMTRKQNNEAAKTSKNNWLDKQNNTEKALYKEAIEILDAKYEKYEQPTYKEIKAKINKARRQGKLYETEDRLGAFKYIATWRYTADMIANYSGRRGHVDNLNNIRICVNDIYLYIRETEECIHIVNHEWFNTELCKWEVIKYFCQYGELQEGIVFMPFMKALKYAEAYKKNLDPSKVKYQIVTASKRDRALFVQNKLKYQGINLSYNYIREHLAEL
jgi:hypothetical protein